MKKKEDKEGELPDEKSCLNGARDEGRSKPQGLRPLGVDIRNDWGPPERMRY